MLKNVYEGVDLETRQKKLDDLFVIVVIVVVFINNLVDRAVEQFLF